MMVGGEKDGWMEKEGGIDGWMDKDGEGPG